ncbi:ABC transporter permease [uncultured Paludibaculum sp.]|uniref:ABC transporter permease n=1 Tax=uncultured Paludibaculum sp. TaxID=1765020 RepID=UPI002AAC2520|nr:ABC transporter permease [uncultured Paludibaculum sp.]
MTWLNRLIRHNEVERGLDKELRFHFDGMVQDLCAQGVPRDEALRQARLQFGGLEQVKEECRDARGTRWVEDLGADLRYATRALRKSPGFTLVAVASLALGIGANTAVFSILDHLMLRLLPGVQAPRELSALARSGGKELDFRFSWPLFEKMRAAVPAGSSMAAMTPMTTLNLAVSGAAAEPVRGQLVSGGYFQMLGVRPAAGRVLSPQDNQRLGGHPVAVISYGYWLRRFARDGSVVGRVVTVNGAAMTIVGVAAEGFLGVMPGDNAEVWVPLLMQQEVHYASNANMNDADTNKPWPSQRGISWLLAFVRIPTGLPAEPAAQRFSAELHADNQLLAGLAEDPAWRAQMEKQRVVLEPAGKGLSDLREAVSAPLSVLMVTVGLVLMIACANIANLLLARASSRRREFAVRLSIGAGRGRLIRQLLTESTLLALLGGVAGLLTGVWLKDVLLRMTENGQPTVGPGLEVPMNWHVLAFTALLCLGAGLLFGLAPALRSTRADLASDLKSGSRTAGPDGAAHGRRWTLGKLLVVGQVAVCLVLLVGATLFALTLRNLSTVDTGFQREHVLAVRIDPRTAGFALERLPALYQELLRQVEAVPGVRTASLSLYSPLSGSARSSGFNIPGLPETPGDSRVMQVNVATPGLFAAYGIQFLQGRGFTPADEAKAPPVAVINEAMARKYFDGPNAAVGRKFKEGGGAKSPAFTIVGVVRDVRMNDLREPVSPMAWFPLAQNPEEYVRSLDVRTTGDPELMASTIRAVVNRAAPALPVRSAVALTRQVENSLSRESFVARLTAAFAAIALLLACLGLYGVMAYTVSRRTAELGLRSALGATRSHVLWLVLRETLGMALVGAVLGLGLTVACMRLAAKLLYGLSPDDPFTLAAACLVLIATAMLAGYLPARRASRVDPVVALRCE